MKHEPFHDPRLTRQENKACEMLFNGFARTEIMDELDIDRKHLSVLFHKARRKGVEVPRGRPGRISSSAVTIHRLVEIRAGLLARGFKGAGLYRTIAERVGLTDNCVSVRLWRFDKGICPKREQGAQA